MKRILYTMAFAAVLLVACQKDNDNVAYEVKITSGIGTRASGTTWHRSDKVGFYMLKNENASVLSSNFEYENILASGPIATFSAVREDQILCYPKTDMVNLVAYYPYQKGIKDNCYKIDVSDQSNLSAIDLMTARKDGVKKTAEVQKMVFEHQLSSIKLNILPGIGISSKDLYNMEIFITGTYSTADYSLLSEFNQLKAGEKEAIRIPQMNQKAEAILIPQTDVSNVWLVIQVLNIPNSNFQLRLPQTNSFNKGMEYTYQITVSNNWDVKIESQSIVPWGQGGSGTGNTDLFIEYVPLKGGEFGMGDKKLDPTSMNNLTNWHQVNLTKGFQMSQYEITSGQYAKFLNDMKIPAVAVGECAKKDGKELFQVSSEYSTPVFNNGKWEVQNERSPMTFVTWYGADAFAKWANAQLPTEAQWEYACRANSEDDYSFGDDVNQLGVYAVYNNNAVNNKPSDVGTKKSNNWGLLDMHGNVMEWCRDSWDQDCYNTSIIDDPCGTSGDLKIIRGGYFNSIDAHCKSAYRAGKDPSTKFAGTGFRVVVENK